MSRAAPSDPVAWQAFLQALQIRSATAPEPAKSKAQVVVLELTPAQCRRQASLIAAVTEAVAAINDGAVGYVIAPPRWRGRIAASLRRRGVATGRPNIHLSSGDARYYVPLTQRSLRFALSTWPQSHRWRHIERLLKYIPGASIVLREILPSLGFTSYRAGGEPFGWLGSHISPSNNREVVVATSWRGADGATTLFAFEGDDPTPRLVAKIVPPSRGAALRDEVGNIEQISPGAGSAGVRVPQLVEYSDAGDHGSLVLSGIPGRPAQLLLGDNPRALTNVVGQISGWLERWHAASLGHVELTAEHCEQRILAPARSLARELDGRGAYIEWLANACGQLAGRTVPFVCAHNDLTMSNVLIDEDGGIGIVDWEEARVDGLPLADFWYSACDAVAAAGHRDRMSAFAECFPANRARGELIARHERELRLAVGGPPDWIELCFHACWIQHAANEQARPNGDNRPFLAIANRLSELALQQT